MNRVAFDTYIATQLAPTLARGNVVILDNLSVHKSTKATEILRERGAWFLFLPQYSPDLNPIEKAFSKLKCAIRSKAGTDSDPSRAVIPIYRGQRFLRIAGSWRRDVIDPAG